MIINVVWLRYAGYNLHWFQHLKQIYNVNINHINKQRYFQHFVPFPFLFSTVLVPTVRADICHERTAFCCYVWRKFPAILKTGVGNQCHIAGPVSWHSWAVWLRCQHRIKLNPLVVCEWAIIEFSYVLFHLHDTKPYKIHAFVLFLLRLWAAGSVTGLYCLLGHLVVT